MVDIEELEKYILLLLFKLKSSQGNLIEMKEDYWDISSAELYNPYEEPKTISLGQLSDDINELKRLLDSEEEAIPYDLKRIGEIFKYLGQNIIDF